MLGSLTDEVQGVVLEVIFLIVVAAVVAVAEFSPFEIVAVMAGAALLVLLVELVAGRERRASTPIPTEAPMAASAPPPEPARPIPAPAPPQAAVPAPDANQPTTGELSLVPVPDLPEEEEPVEEEAGGWAPFAEPAGEEAPNVMAALAVADDGVPDEAEEEAPSDEEEASLPFEPGAEAEPEPAAEAEPEPEPVAEAEAEADPDPEPVGEAEAEPLADVEPEPAAEVEPEPEGDAEPIAGVADAETGIIPRRRRFGRRRREMPAAEPEAEAPKHVRVLPPREAAVAEAELPPWERGFDDTEERRPGA